MLTTLSRRGLCLASIGAVGMAALASQSLPLIGAYGALISILCFGLSANWRGVGRRMQAEVGLVDWSTFRWILRAGELIGLGWAVLAALAS